MKPSIPYWITQVFGQGIFEDKRFLFERIMPFVNCEKTLKKIRAQVTYLNAFDGHSKIQWKVVIVGRFSRKSSLVIDYSIGIIDYTVIFI